MKNNIILLVLLSIFLNNSYAQTWQTLTNAPVSHRFDDIYFLNPQKGWAINPYYSYLSPNQFGRVFTTNDGGQTWQKVFDSSKTFIRCVGFADNLNGWYGNIADTSYLFGHQLTADTIPLYRTFDGGNHWSPVTNIPNPKPVGICGISVATDSVIYAYGRYFGPPILIKSIDKGTTWTSQDMSAYAAGLVDAHFFNKDTGIVIGSYGSPRKALILSTFDGGATWQTRYQSTRLEKESAWKVNFPSRMVGYVSIESQGTSLNYPTFIAKTTDGGLTWTELPFIPNYSMQGIGFINDSVGWVGGDCCNPTNYKTTNGGNTWIADNFFGALIPPFNLTGGYAINRFRNFGDSLLYAGGNTIYKYENYPVSISNVNYLNQFSISPNPFNEQTIFKSQLLNNNSKLLIYNYCGQLVREYKNFNSDAVLINRDNLVNGIYILELLQDNKITIIQKIIIDSN